MPSAKELKTLATTCRKLGIKHFKCETFEFTLGDLPEKLEVSNSPVQAGPRFVQDTIPEDLQDDSLLFWSSHNTTEDEQSPVQ